MQKLIDCMEKIADILEIFSSIQGEGLYVGERQIFIRFRDCNLNCIYCDVDKDKKTFTLTVKQVLEKINKLNRKIKYKTVSLTGGEPLLYADFLKELLAKLKKLKFKIYLETNATLPDELKKILKYIDIIAADIKLPSVTKDSNLWVRHLDFIKIAQAKNIFVKIVVSNKLKINDFKKAVFLVRKINNKIPLIIQPQMRNKAIQISVKKLLVLQDYALRFLENVYVIPQMHKIIGAQ